MMSPRAIADPGLSAADLRASLARSRLYQFSVAAEVQMHPATLGAYLNERRPLPQDLARRIAEAIARLDQAAVTARRRLDAEPSR
jgi:hypothetical protein